MLSERARTRNKAGAFVQQPPSAAEAEVQGYLLPPFGLTVAPQLPAGGVADKTSRPHLSDIPIVKYVDKASPKLF